MMDSAGEEGRRQDCRPLSYTLAGIACVRRICMDLATFHCTPQELQLIGAVEGVSFEALGQRVGLPIAKCP